MFNKIINDLAGQPTFTTEVDGELCLMSGYDKPRFAQATTGISGYLGYGVWADAAYTPVKSANISGSLDAGKYYSIRLVPISQYIIHNADFASGTPTAPATFVTGSTGYTFNLTQHPEQLSFAVALSTAYTSTTVTDTTKTWAVDQWIGYSVVNRESELVATITANTVNELTFDTDIFTATGERFSILAPKTTGYAVYAAEANSLLDSTGASWLFQSFLDYGDTTFNLTSLVVGQVMVEDEYFPPENFKVCNEAKGRLFAGGGITESRGTAASFPQTALLDSALVTVTDAEPKTVYCLGTTYDSAYQVYGNTSGVDQTYFSEGMVGAYFHFNGDSTSYLITAVDVVGQRISLSEAYTGTVTSTPVTFSITSDFDLWYSDINNPHVFRTGNAIEIPDRIVGLAEIRGVEMVFCRGSIWRVPIDTLGQAPTQIEDQIVFSAPYSITKTPKGIVFFDGEGFSITDGSSVLSITKYKANDYLKGLNKDLIHNIRGVYNPSLRRAEFTFAYGTEVTNNYGLYITIDSLNCFGSSRVDCNALWLDKDDDDNRLKVYHGTSGRHTTVGSGDIWEHDEALATDGDLGDKGYFFTITAVDAGTRTLSVESTGGDTNAISGWSCLHISTYQSFTEQFVIDTITSTGTSPQTYDITVGEDWNIDTFAVGDTLVAGGVPLVFGPVWTDFGSPTYQHHVRGIQIDTNGFEGVLYVDHYLDSFDGTPIETKLVYTTAGDFHIRVPFSGGSGNTYGFRIRGYATTPAQINAISRIFDTEI